MEYRIDCTRIDSSAALHRCIAQTLSFPPWYGNNLDALYDCLTDLSTATHLILENWERLPAFAAGFRLVLSEAELDNPDLTVTFR